MERGQHERDLGSNKACVEVRTLGNVWSYRARRALVVICALLLGLSLLPTRALAAGQYYPNQEVILNGVSDGDGGLGYMVIAYNAFNAALLSLGVSATDSRLTSDARAKLSNASTGGDFYLMAQSFFTRSQLDGDLPSWADSPLVQSFVSNWENIAGSGQVGPYQSIFYATVTLELRDSAKEDLDTVLNGGDLGGGGSSDLQDGEFYIYRYPPQDGGTGNYISINGVDYNFGSVTSGYTQFPDGFKVRFTNQSSVDLIKSKMADGYTLLIIGFSFGQNTVSSMSTFRIALVPTSELVITEDNGVKRFKLNYGTSYYYYGRGANTGYGWTNVNMTAKTANFGDTFRQGVNYSYVDYIYSNTLGNYGDFVGPAPPSNWPDSPTVTAPTAPEVPSPDSSTPDPQPAAPTSPTVPSLPSPSLSPDVTYVTPDLSAILDAMNEHCQHLQTAIYTAVSDFYDAFTSWLSSEFEVLRACIRGESQWQMSIVQQEFDDLGEYLWQLAQWLAKQLDFDVSGGGYDDSSVVSWLKRIYFKLGGGSSINTRPDDPVSDPLGIGQWLKGLFDNFIDFLFGLGESALAQLLQKLQALTEKFPFSIPWDIAAILGLMVADPQAPVFDIPLYTLTKDGVEKATDVHVDLSGFDKYMGGIRTMQTILFAAFLAFKVDWFKSALKMEGL